MESFSWSFLKQKRDDYIKRLNKIYETNMEKDGITQISGTAKFIGPKSVQVGETVYTAKHILIAVGSRAWIPDTPGSQKYGKLFH